MNVYPHDGGRMQEPPKLERTINLPKTSFSMKADLPENEPKWRARRTKENPKFVRRAKTRRFSLA
jgi:isoleucyl-tRNA synthetase